MSERKTILVVEDDPAVVDLLRQVGDRLNCSIDACADGRDGLKKATEGSYQLLVLDIQLPGLEGLEICRQVRAKKPDATILILSSRAEEADRVIGLELGADDYVTKPFSTRELEARMKSLLRRSHGCTTSS